MHNVKVINTQLQWNNERPSDDLKSKDSLHVNWSSKVTWKYESIQHTGINEKNMQSDLENMNSITG